MKKGNPIALLPIGVFLVIYLGLGLLFEYGMKIPMGFYNIPIVIAFLVGILVACLLPTCWFTLWKAALPSSSVPPAPSPRSRLTTPPWVRISQRHRLRRMPWLLH